MRIDQIDEAEKGKYGFLTFFKTETDIVLEAMRQAEKTDDLAGLKWAARQFEWLYGMSEPLEWDQETEYGTQVCTMAWVLRVRQDPPPKSLEHRAGYNSTGGEPLAQVVNEKTKFSVS